MLVTVKRQWLTCFIHADRNCSRSSIAVSCLHFTATKLPKIFSNFLAAKTFLRYLIFILTWNYDLTHFRRLRRPYCSAVCARCRERERERERERAVVGVRRKLARFSVLASSLSVFMAVYGTCDVRYGELYKCSSLPLCECRWSSQHRALFHVQTRA